MRSDPTKLLFFREDRHGGPQTPPHPPTPVMFSVAGSLPWALAPAFLPPYQRSLILLEGMGHAYSWFFRKRENAKVGCGCIRKAPFITSAQRSFHAAKETSVV